MGVGRSISAYSSMDFINSDVIKSIGPTFKGFKYLSIFLLIFFYLTKLLFFRIGVALIESKLWLVLFMYLST